MSPIQIQFVGLIENLGDPGWGLWECRYTIDGGYNWHDGTVQGDGEDYAPETLTDENGDPVG